MAQVPFITNSEDGRIPVNWYPAKDDERGVIMRGVPGLEEYTELGDGPIRGMKVAGGALYVVSGANVYRNGLRIGGLLTTTGRVWMEYNLVHVMIVDGVNGYIATTSAVTKITDTDFPTPGSLAFMDSYYIVHEKDTQKFFHSALLDGTDWDALDYSSAEGLPDNIVTVFADHRELWLFGEESTEPYYNSGDADLTFARVSGAFIEAGCAAKYTPAKVDNSMVWFSHMGQVVRADGYVPKIISTRKLERLWKDFTWSTAEALSFNYEGHWFYQLTFPDDDRSFVYDAATGMWHERCYGEPQRLHRSLASCYVKHSGLHLVGSRRDGKIYEMKSDVYTDGGESICRILEASSADKECRDVFFNELEIKFSSGHADQTGQGSDPQVMLQWSDDRGNTWGSEVWSSIGKVGEYLNKVLWHRLGHSSDRMWRLTLTDPVNPLIVAVRLGARLGR